jgi:peptidoglycan/xylan/chitin deacetylase (PgdA/CDA1 family)
MYHTLQKTALKLNVDILFRGLRKGYLILMYHSVPVKVSDTYGTYDVSETFFEKHLQYLRNNYQILGLPSIVEKIKKKVDCESLFCGISFDDGYKDNYEIAYPLLTKYDMPATLFICTGFINEHFETKRMLNWKELKEMKQSGLIDIGAHGHRHQDLTSLPKQEALKEITTSKRTLEDKLDAKIDLFSIPQGKFNEDVKELIKSTGFKAIFTSEPLINCPTQDCYEIGRIAIGKWAQQLPSFFFEVSGLRRTLVRIKHG